jgi:hypothetical protein
MRLGAWRNLQFEDLLAVTVLLCATALMVVLDQVMDFYTIRDASLEWTPARLKRRRIGAKLMLAGEQIAIAAIWTNKAGVSHVEDPWTDTFCVHSF